MLIISFPGVTLGLEKGLVPSYVCSGYFLLAEGLGQGAGAGGEASSEFHRALGPSDGRRF